MKHFWEIHDNNIIILTATWELDSWEWSEKLKNENVFILSICAWWNVHEMYMKCTWSFVLVGENAECTKRVAINKDDITFKILYARALLAKNIVFMRGLWQLNVSLKWYVITSRPEMSRHKYWWLNIIHYMSNKS